MGMERMSMAPCYFFEKARFGYLMSGGTVHDYMEHDGRDSINDFSMGIFNELRREKYGVTPEEQNEYAADFFERALASIEAEVPADAVPHYYDDED